MSSDTASPPRSPNTLDLYKRMYSADPYITDVSMVENDQGEVEVEIMATIGPIVSVFNMPAQDFNDYNRWKIQQDTATIRAENADSLILS